MRRLLPLVLLAALPALGQPIALEPVASGLAAPVGLVHAGDDSGRLFVVLQSGQIVIIRNGELLQGSFLDIRDRVGSGGFEQGLLGLAFHPRFRENGLFFVNYTNLQGDTVVARYGMSVMTNRADPASARTLLTIDQPFANHNGGQLAFGPDGYLYIATGDGGSGGDPGNRAQNLGTLLGKILRIDVDGGDPYAIPPTNPFAGNPAARDEIWSYGLRNPWRFSFDRNTGDLFIGDVGQNAWEEIDFQPAFSTGGENWGWRRMEGLHCFNPSTNCNDGTLALPILEYGREGGNCSVTAGFRYRGHVHPELNGVFFYGDFCSGRIWGARENPDGTWTSTLLLDTNLSISSFGEDQAGNVYVVDRGGTIQRILSAATSTRRRPASRF